MVNNSEAPLMINVIHKFWRLFPTINFSSFWSMNGHSKAYKYFPFYSVAKNHMDGHRSKLKSTTENRNQIKIPVKQVVFHVSLLCCYCCSRGRWVWKVGEITVGDCYLWLRRPVYVFCFSPPLLCFYYSCTYTLKAYIT